MVGSVMTSAIYRRLSNASTKDVSAAKQPMDLREGCALRHNAATVSTLLCLENFILKVWGKEQQRETKSQV